MIALILDDKSLAPWLAPDLTDRETLRNLAHHIDAQLIIHWPVSTKVTGQMARATSR